MHVKSFRAAFYIKGDELCVINSFQIYSGSPFKTAKKFVDREKICLWCFDEDKVNLGELLLFRLIHFWQLFTL